jgi:preprotein translocase subunit SecD
MLYFSRTKTGAMLLSALVVCSFMVPNFFSEETVKGWPAWAQGRLALGTDLQGGTSLQLEVDRNDLRALELASLRPHVRSALHEAGIDLARPVGAHDGSIEVRPLEKSFNAALATLRELAEPFNGVRPVDVVDVGGGLIRVTPSEAALAVHEQQSIDQSLSIIRKRMQMIGLVSATARQEGAGRIAIEMPGVTRPGILLGSGRDALSSSGR